MKEYRPLTFVSGYGPKEDCKIALVGEQPGKNEVLEGRPFVGPAGGVLDECLRIARISRPEVYLTNVFKDLDKHYSSHLRLGKSKYLGDVWYHYRDYLRNELTSCSANVIVAIGGVALFTLCEREGIGGAMVGKGGMWRGSILESTLLPGRKVIPTVHPATVIPPKNIYLNKRLITLDLIRAKEESEFPEIRPLNFKLITKPSFDEVMKFLSECFTKGLEGNVINFDIEVYNEEISCISISYDEMRSMSIPFLDNTGDYFTVDQEGIVWKGLSRILEEERIQKLNHNIGFDSHFLLNKYGIKTHNVRDTMVAQKMLYPDYAVALEFPTAQYTRIPYYKADGKRWFKVGGAWETLWHYSALDSIAPQIVHRGQQGDFNQLGKDSVQCYEEQCRLIEPLVYMQERGIRVDTDGMIREYYDTKKRIEELDQEINKAVGYSINPGSPDQVMHYFYVKKGLKPYTKRGTGRPTVDEVAMIRLARRGYEVANLILERRRLSKRASTYLPVDEQLGALTKISPDGRLRCSYNPAGTDTTRLSSSSDILGFGMNMQNWPHDLLSYLLPDEGYVYYAYDLSQVEDRIVANVGNIKQKIEAYEQGLDPHKLTAALIFGIPYEEVSDEPGSSNLGDGKRSQRYWGKRGNHSLNYDLGYKAFSLDHQIPESEGKWIVERYHTSMPGVRESYQGGIKQLLQRNRTLTNCFGLKRVFLGNLRDDSTYKAAYAQIPQSSTANKINFQGINFIYYNQHLFKPIELLIQIHDSVGFQIPLSVPWEVHAGMLWLIKESLEQRMSVPPEWGEREFETPVDLTMGLTLNKHDGIDFKHDKFPSTAEELSDELRRAYGRIKGTGEGDTSTEGAN